MLGGADVAVMCCNRHCDVVLSSGPDMVFMHAFVPPYGHARCKPCNHACCKLYMHVVDCTCML
jgi:hypothetical protein